MKIKSYIIDNKLLMSEWDYEKNKDLDYSKLTYGSNKIVWWKCSKCGHEFKSEIRKYVENHKCSNCERKKDRQLYLFDK